MILLKLTDYYNNNKDVYVNAGNVCYMLEGEDGHTIIYCNSDTDLPVHVSQTPYLIKQNLVASGVDCISI